jgi:hypothetical protein
MRQRGIIPMQLVTASRQTFRLSFERCSYSFHHVGCTSARASSNCARAPSNFAISSSSKPLAFTLLTSGLSIPQLFLLNSSSIKVAVVSCLASDCEGTENWFSVNGRVRIEAARD